MVCVPCKSRSLKANRRASLDEMDGVRGGWAGGWWFAFLGLDHGIEFVGKYTHQAGLGLRTMRE